MTRRRASALICAVALAVAGALPRSASDRLFWASVAIACVSAAAWGWLSESDDVTTEQSPGA